MGIFGKIFGSYSTKELARIEPIKESVLKLEEQYAAMSDTELKAQTQNFRDRLDTGESIDMILPEALATVREAAYRVLGKKPFPVQIIGAIVLHHKLTETLGLYPAVLAYEIYYSLLHTLKI